MDRRLFSKKLIASVVGLGAAALNLSDASGQGCYRDRDCGTFCYPCASGDGPPSYRCAYNRLCLYKGTVHANCGTELVYAGYYC